MIDNDTWHRQQYEAALRWANCSGPDWNDLNDEQRERIRAENYRYRAEMDLLGKAITPGGPLPTRAPEDAKLNVICDSRSTGPFEPVNVWDL